MNTSPRKKLHLCAKLMLFALLAWLPSNFIMAQSPSSSDGITITTIDTSYRLFVLDGVIIGHFSKDKLEEWGQGDHIKLVKEYTGRRAKSKYGPKGENGVVQIWTKSGISKFSVSEGFSTPKDLIMSDGLPSSVQPKKEVSSRLTNCHFVGELNPLRKKGDKKAQLVKQTKPATTSKSAPFVTNTGTERFEELIKQRALEAEKNSSAEPLPKEDALVLTPKDTSTTQVVEPTTSAPKSEAQFFIYPNPGSGLISFQFNLLADSYVTIEVLTIEMELLHTIGSGKLKQGQQKINWEAPASAKGLFIARLSIEDKVETKAFVLE